MKISSFLRRMFIVGIVCGIPAYAANAQPPEAQPEVVAENDAKLAWPEYWLGISLHDADATLLSQLGLEHGVVVDALAEDGPAAKAGVRQHDLITKAGEFDIKQGGDLIKAVTATSEKELKLQLRREGKQVELAVTPVKRPDNKANLHWVPAKEPVNQRIASWIDALVTQNELQNSEGLDFSLLGPAITLTTPAPLPDDVAITVERIGSKPAQINVKRGDSTWSISEKEIDTLPDDLRGHCRTALGMQPPLMLTAPSADNPTRLMPQLRVHEAQPNPLASLENEVRQLREEISKIRRAVGMKLQ